MATIPSKQGTIFICKWSVSSCDLKGLLQLAVKSTTVSCNHEEKNKRSPEGKNI